MVGYVYKVISKLLVNRMRSFMPRLVGEVQLAFVGGRKIFDGALIACEVVNWRGWIQACLKASMSILVNGCPTKPFNLERGLWQGDLISSFLFVLVGEIVNSMMCRLREKETVRGYRRLLQGFEKMSGLKINFGKSAIIGLNCDE
ncbi:uncharacterized protein [Arachis hypogaea]|uniref:uncharacterized protein n=1 Tax=Arachis hypogaea TaxID=3818 RepID=UPI0010FC5EB3|nr:uncharacterized protein LOC114924464 [Arachis hypogaea]